MTALMSSRTSSLATAVDNHRSRRTALALLAAAGVFAAVAAPAAHAQSALDNILKAKEIKIAIPTDYPPYGFVGTDLKPQGLDVEMANYIGTKLGVKVELIPVTSANRIPYLQTQKADLVISTLGKNAEREKVIDFTAASVAGNLMARNPQLATEFKFVLKDSPNFIGVAKGEDKLRLKVNEILAQAKASGDLDKMAMRWLGRPAGELPQ